MLTGRIIRFDDAKGFGFIAPDGASGQPDVFLHVNGLTDRSKPIEAGTRVAFQMIEGQRGLKAYDVRVLSEDEAAPGESALSAAQQPDLPEADMCDALSRTELASELTELMLTEVPSLTGAQIVELRTALVRYAKSHEWILD
ncbi:cold-shock protein [Lentzea sp. NPDC059081]|uniref:cold-shock protein n=1 Tax=Lentzea sp. NPDC059081 TaxID=3346719 RepID=UPI0036D12416